MQKIKSSYGSYGILVCAIAGIFYAYEFLLRVLPGALQNELMLAFGGISASVYGQIVALYYFAYSPMQLPVGVLMDRYGPKAVLSFSCLICALGSWMFAQTEYLWLVSIGRFLVGFGSAFAFVGVLFLGHHWLPRRYFSLLAGLVTTFAMFTNMFGIIRLTVLVTKVGLLPILNYLALTGVILTGFIFVLVKDAPVAQVAQREPWKLFFQQVFQVLIDTRVWLIGTIGALMYTALSVFGELWGKVYLEQVYHLTSVQAAEGISAIYLGWAVGAPLVGYLSDHTGHRSLPLLLSSFLGAICISLVLYMGNLSLINIKILLFLYGIFTSAEIIVFVMSKEMSRAALSGTVFAAVNMIVMLGGVMLQPLVGYLLDWSAGPIQVSASAHVYSAADYQVALAFLPISLILVAILLMVFKGQLQSRGSFS